MWLWLWCRPPLAWKLPCAKGVALKKKNQIKKQTNKQKENVLCIVLVFKTVLKLTLWPNICSILENVPYPLEQNVFYAVVGLSVLYMSVSPVGL